jgi:hypothetical protein
MFLSKIILAWCTSILTGGILLQDANNRINNLFLFCGYVYHNVINSIIAQKRKTKKCHFFIGVT